MLKNGSTECAHLAFKGRKGERGDISNGVCVDFDPSFDSLSSGGTRVMNSENDSSPNAYVIRQVMRGVHEARTSSTSLSVLSRPRVAPKHGTLCADATLFFRLAQRETLLSFERGV